MFILAIYCLLIAAASLAGGWLPMLWRLTHTRMQLALSFVGGLMLGVGLFQLLPHALYELDNYQTAAGGVMVGFLLMFLLQRFFHAHHHVAPDNEQAQHHHAGHEHAHAHGPGCQHSHGHEGNEADIVMRSDPQANMLSWGGAAIGLTLHSAVDGMAMAAAVRDDLASGHAVWLPGLGIALAVLLHKPFDSLTIGTLMTAGGTSRGGQQLVNLLYALVAPASAVLFYLGLSHWLSGPSLGYALAFSAGAFLCISTSDLLPEVQFHQHDRWKLTACLFAGVLAAWAIEYFGHQHLHDHLKQGDHNHTHAAAPLTPGRTGAA